MKINEQSMKNNTQRPHQTTDPQVLHRGGTVDDHWGSVRLAPGTWYIYVF